MHFRLLTRALGGLDRELEGLVRVGRRVRVARDVECGVVVDVAELGNGDGRVAGVAGAL